MSSAGGSELPPLRVGETTFRPDQAPVTIGRAEDADVRLDVETVSGRHCVLEGMNGVWVLRDVGSRNGTFVDGTRVTELEVTGAVEIVLADPAVGPRLTLEPVAAPAAPVAPAPPAAPAVEGAAPAPAEAPQRLRIGREVDNDVVLPDDFQVSRHHAEVVRSGDESTLVDLKSRNGTFVNGRRIDSAVLRDGDVVAIGAQLFRFAAGSLVPERPEETAGLRATRLTVNLPHGRRLLDGVSFSAEPSSLMAVVGPSGSGKSTFLNAVIGFRPADEGRVLYGERDLYEEFDRLRFRMGYVPQQDVLHRQLTVAKTLRYAAALRFAPDVDGAARAKRVDEVLAELDLTGRADTRVSDLSGGERKRVSVALELLTKPTLLFLDEPTSGLDPGNERELMQVLRDLAAGGRIVVVVTHSTQSLDLCDRVMVLASGGRLAYFGPPAQLLEYFGEFAGAAGYAGLFDAIEEQVDIDWKDRFRRDPRYAQYVGADDTPEEPGTYRSPPPPPPPQQRPTKQLAIVARRQLDLIRGDRRTLIFMLAQAPILALLFFLIFHSQVFTTQEGIQGVQLLWLLAIGATWTGLSGTVLELVQEREIYRRERAVGLSATAYLGAKALVVGSIAAVQGALLTIFVLFWQNTPPKDTLCPQNGAPESCFLEVVKAQPFVREKHFDFSDLIGGSLFSSVPLELVIDIALAGVAAAMLGLLISAVARTSDQALRLLPVVLAAQVVLSLPITSGGTTVSVISVPASARWGTAAAESTMSGEELQLASYTGGATGLYVLNVAIHRYRGTQEQLTRLFERRFNDGIKNSRAPGWGHKPATWLGDIALLLVLGGAGLAGTWLLLRRSDRRARHAPAQQVTQPVRAATPA